MSWKRKQHFAKPSKRWSRVKIKSEIYESFSAFPPLPPRTDIFHVTWIFFSADTISSFMYEKRTLDFNSLSLSWVNEKLRKERIFNYEITHKSYSMVFCTWNLLSDISISTSTSTSVMKFFIREGGKSFTFVSLVFKIGKFRIFHFFLIELKVVDDIDQL